MIPKEARQKFNVHKADAKRRGVEFLFTLEEWWGWWSQGGRWEQRGRGRGKLVMARTGDVGPYAPWNVRAATHGENTQETATWKRSGGAKTFHARRRAKGILPTLAKRGAGHPRSRPVQTPIGNFESGYLAADALKVSSTTIYNRIRRGDAGYAWADENAR